jgi:hypothetical protein
MFGFIETLKGIQFLVANHFMQETPEAIAAFLKEEGLRKSKIGEYLGEG